MKNAWKNIQEHLSKTVSTSAFNLWLSQLEGYIEDNTLIVVSPTKYIATRINSKYKSSIEKIASTLFNSIENVHIEVASDIQDVKQFSPITETVVKNVQTHNTMGLIQARKNSSSSAPILSAKETEDNAIKKTPSINIVGISLPLPIKKELLECTSPQASSLSSRTEMISSELMNKTVQELQNLQDISNKHVQKNSDKAIPSACGMALPMDDCSSNSHSKHHMQLRLDLQVKRSPKKFQYSFNNFVVGDCNSLAFASSQALCDTNNSLASTLYLSSPPGLGKTHLLQSLGTELIKASNVNSLHIEYLSAEDFTSQFTLAMQRKELGEFLGKLKSADVFLLEDVHFLQGKEKIQSQLLSIIKALQAQGSRIAVSSSFSLKEVKQMDEQLSSCFQEGYVANIGIPDFSIRKQIVENKAKYHNVFLPETVADILAENICSDIRQIEGCLKTIILKARSMKQEINASMAMEILSAYDVSEKKITFDDIVSTVCKYFGLSLDRLTSKTRQKECVLARNLIFYLARANTDMTLKEVAQFFNRQHSTVIKGITNVELELVRSTPKAQQMLSVVNLLDPHKAIHA